MPVATYDRWKLSGPPEVKVIDTCIFCRKDLHVGQAVVVTDEGPTCDNDCFLEYAMEALGYRKTELEG